MTRLRSRGRAPCCLFAALIMGAWATGCAYVGPQRANVAPLRGLPPATANVDSLLPLFPHAVRLTPESKPDVLGTPPIQIMVADGTHLGVNEPSSDGMRDCVILTWPEKAGEYLHVQAYIHRYADPSRADADFESALKYLHGEDTSGGTQGDRYALSKVRQGVSDLWQPLDHYWSEAVFQKGAVVITITEVSSDRDGRLKDRLIEQIVHAFKREPLAPQPWQGR